MIRSLKGRGLKRFYSSGDRSGIGADLVDTVERILSALNSALTPQELNLPRYRLHALKGDRAGQHSIRINDRYRVCFEWRNGEAANVEIVDYH